MFGCIRRLKLNENDAFDEAGSKQCYCGRNKQSIPHLQSSSRDRMKNDEVVCRKRPSYMILDSDYAEGETSRETRTLSSVCHCEFLSFLRLDAS